MRHLWPILLCLCALPAPAEIYKQAIPTEHGFRLLWWPVLKPAPGWTHDEDASRAASVNAFVPAGHSFANAPAVIYARALYKPRMPETKSLAQFIAEDRARFEADYSGVDVQELAPVAVSAAGKLRYFSFRYFSSPTRQQGSFERVVYGEDPDYFLVFTLSARTPDELEKARPAFEQMLLSYGPEQSSSTPEPKPGPNALPNGTFQIK